MMLIDPSVLRNTLGFDDMSDINDAIEAALTSATSSLSARLNSQFDAGTATDTWFVVEPIRHSGLLRQTEFRTSTGFINTVASFSYAPELSAFGTSDAIDALSSVVVSKEKGLIADIKTDYTSMFVRATYTYGFEPDDTYVEVYDPAVVPHWLKEAAKLQALILLATNPALKQAGVEIDSYGYASLKQQGPAAVLQTILAQHARYTPLALLPL